MAQSAKYLVIGSLEPYSGKSAAMIGVADQLKAKGLDLAYGKPVSGGSGVNEEIDEDVAFIAKTLQLGPDRILPTVVNLGDFEVFRKRLEQVDQTDYLGALRQSAVHQAKSCSQCTHHAPRDEASVVITLRVMIGAGSDVDC